MGRHAARRGTPCRDSRVPVRSGRPHARQQRRAREGRSVMAIVRIPEENRTLSDDGAIGRYLSDRGIEFERCPPDFAGVDIPSVATADQVLAAYGDKIGELKARGGYVTADVIDVNAD